MHCGETLADGTITVCPAGVLDIPVRDVFVVKETMAGPLPSAGADDGHRHIYALVVDSDGEAENDWVYHPPYDWDFFQGADRWYQLFWSPDTSAWSLTVSQVDATQTVTPSPSSVRAVVDGDTITWFVSASELPASAPTYRVTASGHDGAFSPSDRGGDVSGADPDGAASAAADSVATPSAARRSGASVAETTRHERRLSERRAVNVGRVVPASLRDGLESLVA